MGGPLYISSAVCDRSRRPGSARPFGAGDENANPAAPLQGVRKTRPASARPRLMTSAPHTQVQRGSAPSARPPSSRHPSNARLPVRPGSARPASARPASARPASARPASAATTIPQFSDRSDGAQEWKPTYRPLSASGCSVKEPWATKVPVTRASSARSRSRRPAIARVDSGRRPAKVCPDPVEVKGAVEREMAALVRVVTLERERAAARRAPGAPPDITSLACYSKVFLHLINRCVPLRPLLSRIKDAYDDTANGLIRSLQRGAAKISRNQTGVDRVAGLDSLGLLATSEDPSDGRFAAENAALQAALDSVHGRTEAAKGAAMQRRRSVANKREELCELKHSCARLKDTVEALRSTQNRVVDSLKKLQDQRVGFDVHKKSGYWLKRKIDDYKAHTNELRGQMCREELERQEVEAKLQEVTQTRREREEDCEYTTQEMLKCRQETEILRTQTLQTEASFREYERSVGPGTPRPCWDQVEKDLTHGSFAENVSAEINDEVTLYRRTYGTEPLHLDVNQGSATLALEVAEHVAQLRTTLVDTQRQLTDVETLRAKKMKEEEQLKAVIKAEQHAAAESQHTKKFFILQGTGPNVPIYMRGVGKVRDLFMSKAEAEEIIKNVWDTKIRSDSRKNAKQKPLGAFLEGWMKTTYGMRALEKTYNLIDAVKRFEYDADCALFHLVLKGELCESVYLEESRMIDSFMEALVAEDRKHSNEGKRSKRLRRPDFLRTLESHFVNKKTQNELYALKRALNYDQPTSYIMYEELLQENDRADQGHFAEELRDQFVLSVQESYIAIDQSIREATIKRAAENGQIIRTEGVKRIAAHRILFEVASCTKQCDTLMKEALLNACPLCEYKRDNHIIVEGGTGTEMYLVIEGTAFAEKNGHEKLVEYGPGHLFGEVSALLARDESALGDDARRQATVTVHKDTLVMILNKDDITLRRVEAVRAGDNNAAQCCTNALAAISSILELQAAVSKVTLDSYRAAESIARAKRNQVLTDRKTDRGSSMNLDYGLWTTVANCWSGCLDYVGADDPDYDYHAEKQKRKHVGGPASAQKRARPLMLAGLGEDAPPGWEIGAGGLTCTKRVWLPDFVKRLRSVFAPLARPQWLQERQQGQEVMPVGHRELSAVEKQTVSDVWDELEIDGSGSLPSSKLADIIDFVYGYEITHQEEHALLLATRYGGQVDASDACVTKEELLHAMATVKELSHCEQFFEWRRTFKHLVCYSCSPIRTILVPVSASLTSSRYHHRLTFVYAYLRVSATALHSRETQRHAQTCAA